MSDKPPTASERKVACHMNIPSHETAFQVLCLQAADEERGDVLFGESLARARDFALPFMVGEKFPSIYFEFPLKGDPFLDITVLFGQLEPGTRIDSAAANGTGDMLDWFAQAREEDDNISCGFELDTKEPALPRAAVHFQPRLRTELVEPFCETIGEMDKAALYLAQASRMPEGWPLSFFGMFRGRANSPLRICGYMGYSAKSACADDPRELAAAFDAIGFTAYDDAMLGQVSQVMRIAPGSIDFQFDVLPDGSLGSTFALDVQFEIEQPELVKERFKTGPIARFMNLIQSWDIADERWKLVADSAFARAIPVELDDGSIGKYSFTLMPQWAKVRWRDCVLQTSKLYLLGSAGFLDS